MTCSAATVARLPLLAGGALNMSHGDASLSNDNCIAPEYCTVYVYWIA